MNDFRRPEPLLNERNKEYWHSGADGQLRIAQCKACRWRMHPPRPVCSRCLGREIDFSPVSGRGAVYSFTVNRYAWFPGMQPPYVVAEVELDDQEGLRVTTGIVGCLPETVRIGMPVHVAFEKAGDSWVPVFHP